MSRAKASRSMLEPGGISRCSARSTSPNPSCRICALAARKLRALRIFSQKLGRDGRAGLIVPRKQIQRIAFPGPVLHDLRRQLHEIPGHVHSGKSAQFHAGQTMVQQMAELVKNGLHLTMRQQGWTILAGRREVAADQAQMRILPSRCLPAMRLAGDQSVHPSAAAFVLARKPVRVKCAHQLVAARPALVVDFVILHVRIPARHAASFPAPRFRTAGARSRTFPYERSPAGSRAAEPPHRNRTARRAAFPRNMRYPKDAVPLFRRKPAKSAFSFSKCASVLCLKSSRNCCARSPACAIRSSSTRSAKSR